MLTSLQARKHYGDPKAESAMVVFDVPRECQAPAIPRRIYCNRDLVLPLSKALRLVIDRCLAGKIRTWDGCFNIRPRRGGTSASLHSWGLAIDINASWNRMGQPSTQDPRLVACFTEAGFDWGGAWVRQDAMHFQLAEIPK